MSRDDAFGDAVYDAWMSGLEPNGVSRDRVYETFDQTGDRFAAAEAEVRYLRRRERERKEAENWNQYEDEYGT